MLRNSIFLSLRRKYIQDTDNEGTLNLEVTVYTAAQKNEGS